jgi:hypothetical protein
MKYNKINIADAVTDDSINGGHGGGDGGIVRALVARLGGDTSDKSICSIEETCKNHLISFAAEKSRISGEVVDFNAYVTELGL